MLETFTKITAMPALTVQKHERGQITKTEKQKTTNILFIVNKGFNIKTLSSKYSYPRSV